MLLTGILFSSGELSSRFSGTGSVKVRLDAISSLQSMLISPYLAGYAALMHTPPQVNRLGAAD
jgi:hypothetical protein